MAIGRLDDVAFFRGGRSRRRRVIVEGNHHAGKSV
jgi:hypothetical protein